MIFQNYGFNQNYPVAGGTPPATQYVYICGYNFYKWKGTQLGSAAAGGIAKIGLDGTLDTTWTSNANPSTSNQVRFFTMLGNNVYADYRFPNSSTRAFRKLNADGTLAYTATTSGGTIWGVSSFEGTNFVMITGDTNINYAGNTVKGVGKLSDTISVDTGFATNIGTGPNAFVISANPSSDRIAVSGQFTTWNSSATYDKFVVLNHDGTRDTGFTRSGAFTGNVNGGKFLGGKWIVYGPFTAYGGVTNNRLMAFNTDGSVDTTFTSNLGTGFNGEVAAIYPVSSTRFLAVGSFTSLNGTTMTRAALVNTDGTIVTYPFGSGFNTSPQYADVDASGKFYFAGLSTTSYNGTTIYNAVSTNTDGSINTTFVTGTGMQTSASGTSEAGGLFIR